LYGEGLHYWWVKETFIARKVIIPTPVLFKQFGIMAFTIWISDPKRAPKPKHAYDWTGSFLYLPALHFDSGKTLGLVMSGCSALQFIINVANDNPLLTRDRDEPFGRGNRRHPIEKLTQFGAIVGDERRLESLYYVRYITDEQVYTPNGAPVRVNDVIGYPIYISAHPPVATRGTRPFPLNNSSDLPSNNFFFGNPDQIIKAI
jgi:hypothetical protein